MRDFSDLERVMLEHSLGERQQARCLEADSMKIHSRPEPSAPKGGPFALHRDIFADPGNRHQWFFGPFASGGSDPVEDVVQCLDKTSVLVLAPMVTLSQPPPIGRTMTPRLMKSSAASSAGIPSAK